MDDARVSSAPSIHYFRGWHSRIYWECMRGSYLYRQACLWVASVYSVDIASGTLLATIAPIQGASYILSVTADVVFGGSVLAGVIFSPNGQDSLESVST